jgi:hypothetical protein
MELIDKLKFFILKVFRNNRIIGVIDLLLLFSTIIITFIWLKYDKQTLEPITVICLSLIAFFDILKIIIVMPNIPKLTFSEYKSHSKMDSSFFIGITLTNINDAISIMKTENKGLFLVIYDNNHSTKSKLNYSLGYFTEYEKTKSLINEYFIQAIVSNDEYDVLKYVPENYHMENCLLVVLNKNYEIIRQEGVYANTDEGLRKVREDIAKMECKQPNGT